MPYIVISTLVQSKDVQTTVGDERSDPEIMQYLGASLPEYRVDDPPRVVMNKLEKIGYRVVAMAGVGQTCIWTMHRAVELGRIGPVAKLSSM